MINAVIYTKESGCAPCQVAKQLIEKKCLKLEIKNADEHLDFLRENNLTEMPVLLTEDGEYTGRNTIKALMQM